MVDIKDFDRANGQRPRISLELQAGEKSALYGFPSPMLVSVALHPRADSEGYIRVTLTAPDKVRAGEALWVVWPAGLVKGATADILDGPFTAFQAVCTKGSMTVEAVR